MKILFLGNNRVGLDVLLHLRHLNEELVGLVVHPTDRQKCGRDIIEAAALTSDRVFFGNQLRQPDVIDAIRKLQPDIGLSVFFGHILKPEFLEIFPRGVINLHPSFLPFNRGQYPNVWSIIEETPAGATLHFIDPGIDTGDIISQREVTVESIDTGLSLYEKLETCCLDLFRESWPIIRAGNPPRHPQPTNCGTSHRTRDVDRIDHINLDQKTTAREVINLLRARTFPPYRGAFFIENSRKITLRLTLEYEDEEP